MNSTEIVELDKHYVSLYNTAIEKIFKDHDKYMVAGDHTTYNKFLEFMKKNCGVKYTPEFGFIVLKVRKFIESMEVKNTNSSIVVTLHDIIDKFSRTELGSEHCNSEKLFMAVLLAIQILHWPTHRYGNEYTLTFKFAPSLLGRSGLQKTSKICSGNKSISSSEDPVAANIFRFVDTSELNPKPVSPSIEAVPPPPNDGNYSNEWGWPSVKDLQSPPPAEELQPRPLTGDDFYEKYKLSGLTSKEAIEDAERYRKIVLTKFEKKEKIYDKKFSELPNIGKIPTEYQLNIVKPEIEREKDLFNDLLELLSLKQDADLYNKLTFIHGIFLKCELQNTRCSKIATIILGLGSNLHILTGGGSKSRRRRRHRRKPARKTRRGRTRTRKSKSKSKSKPKTHRRRRHSRVRVRKHKKYTSRRR